MKGNKHVHRNMPDYASGRSGESIGGDEEMTDVERKTFCAALSRYGARYKVRERRCATGEIR